MSLCVGSNCWFIECGVGFEFICFIRFVLLCFSLLHFLLLFFALLYLDTYYHRTII
jgi:hypothetical protein